MLCESEFISSSPSASLAPNTPPPVPPATPATGAATRPYASADSLSLRIQNSECFRCGKLGHWAINCPSKDNSSKRSQAFNGEATDDPVIQCRCGGGACNLLTSRTAKNPERKFYCCPLRGARNCKFFRWRDEVTQKEIEFSPKNDFPMCHCGAGICRKETKKSGPGAGRSCYVCPIKQGFGACGFKKWEDTQGNKTVNDQTDESGQCGSPQSPCDSLDIFETANNDLRSSENILHEDFPNSVIVPISSEQARSSHEDENAESFCPVTTKAKRVSHFATKSKIRKRQAEFWREILVAGDILSRGNIPYQELGLHVLGWLGRLVFPPVCGIREPPSKPFFCGIFPTFDPIVIPQDWIMPSVDNVTSNVNNLSPSTTDHDLELQNNVLCKPTRLKRPFMDNQDEEFMQSILSILEQSALLIQNKFVARLNSMDPSDSDSMTRLADNTFSTLDNLSIDYTPFSMNVKEFIYSAARLAKVEKSICKEQSMEKLNELYAVEKLRFDDFIRDHDAAVAALEALEKRLLSLREEASQLREMLFLIETKERHCAVETEDCKTHVELILRKKLESETRLEKAEAARKLCKEREEAKVALEKVYRSITRTSCLRLRKRQKI